MTIKKILTVFGTRSEAVAVDAVKLVGRDIEKVVTGLEVLLSDQDVYKAMSFVRNSYGIASHANEF